MPNAREELFENAKIFHINDTNRLKTQPKPSGAYLEGTYFYNNKKDEDRSLDIHLPNEKKDTYPIIFYVHGGAWIYGNKDLYSYFCTYMASKGFAVVAINYRVLPKTDLNGIAKDIFAALSWLKENAASKNLNLNRLYLIGDSAGGQLAGLTLGINYSKTMQGLYRIKDLGLDFKASCLVCPCRSVELNRSGESALYVNHELEMLALGGRGELNPIKTHMSIPDVLRDCFKDGVINSIKPILLISGYYDSCYENTLNIKSDLEKAKVPHELFAYSKDDPDYLTHDYPINRWEYEESQKANNYMADFFLKNY